MSIVFRPFVVCDLCGERGPTPEREAPSLAVWFRCVEHPVPWDWMESAYGRLQEAVSSDWIVEWPQPPDEGSSIPYRECGRLSLPAAVRHRLYCPRCWDLLGSWLPLEDEFLRWILLFARDEPKVGIDEQLEQVMRVARGVIDSRDGKVGDLWWWLRHLAAGLEHPQAETGSLLSDRERTELSGDPVLVRRALAVLETWLCRSIGRAAPLEA